MPSPFVISFPMSKPFCFCHIKKARKKKRRICFFTFSSSRSNSNKKKTHVQSCLRFHCRWGTSVHETLRMGWFYWSLGRNNEIGSQSMCRCCTLVWNHGCQSYKNKDIPLFSIMSYVLTIVCSQDCHVNNVFRTIYGGKFQNSAMWRIFTSWHTYGTTVSIRYLYSSGLPSCLYFLLLQFHI